MRRFVALLAIALPTVASSADAQQVSIASALDAGLLTCQKWVLEPATWASDDAKFAANIGLGEKLEAIESIPSGLLPPEMTTGLNHYWRIDASAGNVLFVAASTTTPVCNIIGGGPSDFQPEAEAALARTTFSTAWKRSDHSQRGDMATDTFTSLISPHAQLIISRAAKAGDRTDRIQFLATLLYTIG